MGKAKTSFPWDDVMHSLPVTGCLSTWYAVVHTLCKAQWGCGECGVTLPLPFAKSFGRASRRYVGVLPARPSLAIATGVRAQGPDEQIAELREGSGNYGSRFAPARVVW